MPAEPVSKARGTGDSRDKDPILRTKTKSLALSSPELTGYRLMTVAAWRTEGEGGGIGADAGVDEPSQADKAQARKNVSKRRECVRAATLQTSLRYICNC